MVDEDHRWGGLYDEASAQQGRRAQQECLPSRNACPAGMPAQQECLPSRLWPDSLKM